MHERLKKNLSVTRRDIISTAFQWGHGRPLVLPFSGNWFSATCIFGSNKHVARLPLVLRNFFIQHSSKILCSLDSHLDRFVLQISNNLIEKNQFQYLPTQYSKNQVKHEKGAEDYKRNKINPVEAASKSVISLSKSNAFVIIQNSHFTRKH